MTAYHRRKTAKEIPAGTRFGKLVVVRRAEGTGGCGVPIKWVCLCDCGNEKIVPGTSLRRGSTTTCGSAQHRRSTFAEKLEKMITVMPNGCWIWGKGKRVQHKIVTDNGRRVFAHRIAYEHFKGPIPEGMYVCHDCPGGDNPDCCNPDHLWLGTHKENLQDASKKGWHKKNRERGGT